MQHFVEELKKILEASASADPAVEGLHIEHFEQTARVSAGMERSIELGKRCRHASGIPCILNSTPRAQV